jgi:hypothetical protein
VTGFAGASGFATGFGAGFGAGGGEGGGGGATTGAGLMAETAGLIGRASSSACSCAFFSAFLVGCFLSFGATSRSRKPCLAGLRAIMGNTTWMGSNGRSGASGTTARAFAAALSVAVPPPALGRTTPVPGRTTPVPGRT